MLKRSSTADSTCALKKRTQNFKKEYSDEFPCIRQGRMCDTNAYCTVCNTEFSVKYGGKNDITRHIANQKHTSLSKIASESKKVGNFFASPASGSQNKTDSATIRAEVMLVDLAIELNLPLSILDRFTKAFKIMFKKDDVAKQFQCGRSKGTAIIKEIAAKSTLSLAERMKHYTFTVSTDGSNDMGSSKLFPIVIRIFDPEVELVTSNLLSIPACEGSATGERIFDLIEAEFKVHNIPWANCISLGSDNAPVMVGKNKGVYGLMLKQQPNLYLSACVCHLVHIAAEKAALCLPLNVDQLLIDVYYYLDKSSKRLGAFKDFQILHEIKENKILKHVNTRWLSIKRCLPRLIENWESLYDFFRQQEKAASKDADKSRVAQLRKTFSSPTNRLICVFLKEALEPFDEINTELQSDSPKVHLLRRRLHKLLRALLIRFVKPVALLNKSITEVNVLDESNLKDNVDLHIGQGALDIISKKEEYHLREERLVDFYKGVKQFYQTAVKYIKEKLPLEDEFLQHAEVIDVRKQTESSVTSLEFFLNRFPTLIPKGATLADIKLEFSLYQSTNIESCQNERLDATWSSIGKLLEDGEPVFKFVPIIMLSIMTIPHSSAHCERIFSIVKRNKTDFRSRLNHETVEALLIAKSRPGDALEREYSETDLQDLKSAYFRSLKGDSTQ